MRTILLAAGRGRRLGPLAQQGPKCMVLVEGEPLLKRTLQGLLSCGIQKIIIVVGYQKEKISTLLESEKTLLDKTEVVTVTNPNFTQGNIVSLWCGAPYFDEDLLIMDADVYFDVTMLKRLIASPKSNCFLLDSSFKNTGEEVVLMTRNGRVLHLGKTPTLPQGYDLLGESVGFLKLCRQDTGILKAILQEMIQQGQTDVEYEQAYERLLQKVPVGFELVGNDFWMEIDFPEDLEQLQNHLEADCPHHRDTEMPQKHGERELGSRDKNKPKSKYFFLTPAP